MKHWQRAIRETITKIWGQSALDPYERACRLFEEATELAQAMGMSQEMGQSIFDNTYSKPAGDLPNEIGGTFICLLAATDAVGHDAYKCMHAEYERIRQPELMDKLRNKHAEKVRQGRAFGSPGN